MRELRRRDCRSELASIQVSWFLKFWRISGWWFLSTWIFLPWLRSKLFLYFYCRIIMYIHRDSNFSNTSKFSHFANWRTWKNYMFWQTFFSRYNSLKKENILVNNCWYNFVSRQFDSFADEVHRETVGTRCPRSRNERVPNEILQRIERLTFSIFYINDYFHRIFNS